MSEKITTQLTACFVLWLVIALAVQAEELNPGLMQWSFDYKGTTVPVTVWFPSRSEAREIPAGPFTLRAAQDAEIAPGLHPLILVSHGTGGSTIAHHPLAEALAARGYLVAALEHPGDNYRDRSLVADKRYFDDRPRQLRAMLIAITTDKTLSAQVDLDRVGALGHSVGGYTVAALIGASADRPSLVEHCNSVADDPSCQYREPSIGVSSPSDQKFKLPDGVDGEPTTVAIRSAVLLAPLGSVLSNSSRINSDIATLVISAGHDEVLPLQYHTKRLRQIAAHATFRVEPDAGHFSFIAPVTSAWRKQLGQVSIDPPGFDRQAFNNRLALEIGQWFDDTLPLNSNK